MNDSTAALEARSKSAWPISGRVERSSPTIAPTNALSATSSENCARFSRSPSSTGRWVTSPARAQWPAGAVGGHDLGLSLRRRRDLVQQRSDEGLLAIEAQRLVMAALEPDRGDRVGRQ